MEVDQRGVLPGGEQRILPLLLPVCRGRNLRVFRRDIRLLPGALQGVCCFVLFSQVLAPGPAGRFVVSA